MKNSVCLMAVLHASAVLFGCSTARTYNIPFEKAEAELFTHLHLDPIQTTTKPHWVQAKAEGELAKAMSMELYRVEMNEYEPGNALSFTCSHRYNIMASGTESIRFDLKKLTPQETKITVDYLDSFVTFIPPFLIVNPGPGREREIHRLIWANGRDTEKVTSSP